MVYILDNDLEEKPENNLLSSNERLSSSEDYGNEEGTIQETKEMVPAAKKLDSTIKKTDALYNEEAKTFFVEAERNANDSLTGKEAIQSELLDFLIGLANLTDFRRY